MSTRFQNELAQGFDVNALNELSDSYGNEAVTNIYRTEFTYDGKMRRRVRKEYAWQFGNWVLTNEVRYVYAGNLVIQERNAFNLPAVAYTRGIDLSGSMEGAGGIGGLLARSDQSTINSSQSTSYYHCDGNGNVTMLINSLQLPVAKYLYTPFGYVLAASGPLAEANLYRFSSKEHHPGSGLYYYGRRFYEPNLQRWLNRDTIGEEGGVNLYGAIRNDPLNFYDAFGADPGTLGLFWQSVKQSWGSDVARYQGKIAANAVDLIASSVKPFLSGPLASARDQYQSLVNVSQKLGHLSAEPCARQQLLNNLLNYALTPEGIADIATTIELTLAGGLISAEADAGAFANAANRVESINPGAIRFSQSSVNGVEEIAVSMRANGWQGGPIDVVRMGDGGLTTFDNARVLAASRAGIDVQAVVREAAEAFPAGRWMPRTGIQPTTWEQAVQVRIQQQSRLFRQRYPNGSPITGSAQ